ncbi:hypothetical protein [Halorubrum sp. C191]|jgi:hypothetical protein|uniref:hypothetical protein n=1 Tax=Halorubrum sp. C191 TaxID=1383842 RepID=UPI001F52DEF5|nr:hypothetical protein [Halorubrum sp. C191]
MLSEAERNALNTRLTEVGPDELTVKGISKVESMEFLEQDFTDDDSQRGLSEF